MQSGYAGAAHQHHGPSPCTLAPEVPTRLYNQPDSNQDCYAASVGGMKAGVSVKRRSTVSFERCAGAMSC